jgi:arylsulfatase A-like enzyme
VSSPDKHGAAPRSRPFLWALLFAAALAGAWTLLRPPPPRNVLLITLDTFRADALDPEDTPAILDAAREGMRFLKARTPAPLTLPAHTTILTGVLPPVHGIRDNTASPIPDPDVRPYRLLAEDFHDAGYATAAFVASGVLDQRYRLNRGFDEYREPAAPSPGAPSFPELEAKDQVERVRAWMTRSRPQGKPFFVWVHLWDAHAPYRPYAGDERRAGTDAGDPNPLLYKGEVRRVDAAVEEILKLVDRGTTYVVIVADHGESLGEHGEATHGQLCHGATMDVPLLLLGPGVPRREESRVAGLEDVAPTLRSLCRLRARATDGFDLLALPEERVAVGESLEDHRLYRWAQQSVAFDGRFALLDGGPRIELFDRASDPHENTPLEDAPSRPPFERLDRALHAYRDRRGPLGRGTELTAAPLYYGIPFIPEADFLPVAENRKLRDVETALPDAALLGRATGAIAAGGRDLVRAFLGPLEEMERRDPSNPAPCLVRGRALLLALGDPKGAVAALEEAVRRGYDSPDVDRLLEKAARDAGDVAAQERVEARQKARKKPAR